MFCPQCGKQNPDNAAFCAGCGKQLPSPKVTTATTTPTATRTQSSKKKRLPLIVGVAAVVVVIFVLSRFIFAGGAPTTVDNLASKVSSATQTFYESDFGDESFETYCDAIIDLMNDEMVDAAMAQEGYESRDDLSALFSDYFSGAMNDMGDIMDYVDIDVSIYAGDQLDADSLDSINETLQDELEVDLTADDAVDLDMDITFTFTQDYLTYSAGDTQTQTAISTGLIAIEIDGHWYLWID